MTIGSIACSCRGENPNCYRCDGTGFYNSDDLLKEYVPFRESKSFLHATPLELQGHQDRIIPEEHQLSVKDETGNKGGITKNVTSGKICRASLKSPRLPKMPASRLKDFNSNKVFTAEIYERIEQLISKREAKKCKLTELFRQHAIFDYDGVDVFLANYAISGFLLNLHQYYEVCLYKSHGNKQYEVVLSDSEKLLNKIQKRVTETRVRTKNHRHLASTQDNNQYDGFKANNDGYKEMSDGSKDYSHNARDNGRFGSMPSFDAMDDESFS